MGYDDFYCGYEFDYDIEELKNRLRNSVKKEILDELAYLREENEQLRDVKERMEKIEREYQVAMKNAAREARKLRLHELVKECDRVYWQVGCDVTEQPKCDKCNQYRMIEYTTPLGRHATEACTCKEKIVKRVPEACYATELDVRNGEAVVWFAPERRDSDFAELRALKKENVCDNTDFSTLDMTKAYFSSQEICKSYCDWLNSRRNAK